MSNRGLWARLIKAVIPSVCEGPGRAGGAHQPELFGTTRPPRSLAYARDDRALFASGSGLTSYLVTHASCHHSALSTQHPALALSTQHSLVRSHEVDEPCFHVRVDQF